MERKNTAWNLDFCKTDNSNFSKPGKRKDLINIHCTYTLQSNVFSDLVITH